MDTQRQPLRQMVHAHTHTHIRLAHVPSAHYSTYLLYTVFVCIGITTGPVWYVGTYSLADAAQQTCNGATQQFGVNTMPLRAPSSFMHLQCTANHFERFYRSNAPATPVHRSSCALSHACAHRYDQYVCPFLNLHFRGDEAGSILDMRKRSASHAPYLPTPRKWSNVTMSETPEYNATAIPF
jgi:hypothetical protein